MITVKFNNNGFEVSGHSGYSTEDTDIVCAAVSSATQLTVNAITEILKIDADVFVDEQSATIRLVVKPKDIDKTVKTVLDAFKLQISLIAENYAEYVSIN